jgi:hypothetical protein
MGTVQTVYCDGTAIGSPGKNANCGPVPSKKKDHIPRLLTPPAPNAWRCSALAGTTTTRLLPDGLAVGPARS